MTHLADRFCYRLHSAGLIAGLFRRAFSVLFSFSVTTPHTIAHSKSTDTHSCAKMALSAEQRFELIKENLGEVLNPELIESILKEGRNPRVYWGKNCPP